LDAFFGGALRVPSLYFKVKTHGLTFVRRTRMVFSKKFFWNILEAWLLENLFCTSDVVFSGGCVLVLRVADHHVAWAFFSIFFWLCASLMSYIFLMKRLDVTSIFTILIYLLSKNVDDKIRIKRFHLPHVSSPYMAPITHLFLIFFLNTYLDLEVLRFC
jgi:hypothetical protein